MSRRPDTSALRQALAAVEAQQYTNRLQSVRVPMAPGRRVERIDYDAPGAAMADPGSGTIFSQGPMGKFEGAHESAHLLEKFLTPADRLRFAGLMGKPKAPWVVGEPGGPGYRGSLSERFADMTAMAAIGFDPQGGRMISAYMDKPPSRRQLMRFARSLERFGDRNDLPRYERPVYRAPAR